MRFRELFDVELGEGVEDGFFEGYAVVGVGVVGGDVDALIWVSPSLLGMARRMSVVAVLPSSEEMTMRGGGG